jgi:hypothetical protein
MVIPLLSCSKLLFSYAEAKEEFALKPPNFVPKPAGLALYRVKQGASSLLK